MVTKYELPSWLFGDKNYNLCLSDDIDSLFSCIVLQQLKGWSIKGFYSFDNMYLVDGVTTNMVGVDIDLIDGNCFGNHVTKITSKDTVNQNCVNLNNFENISRSNYIHKYGGSTLLQILSIYNVDLSYLNEKQLMTLLAVDVSFLGFYYDNRIIRQAHKYFMDDVLGYPILLEIEQKHTKQEFYNLVEEYKLYGKIKMINGQLQTDIDLEGLTNLFGLPFELPKYGFKSIGTLQNNISNINNMKNKADIGANLFSLAVTSKNTICYSTYA